MTKTQYVDFEINKIYILCFLFSSAIIRLYAKKSRDGFCERSKG